MSVFLVHKSLLFIKNHTHTAIPLLEMKHCIASDEEPRWNYIYHDAHVFCSVAEHHSKCSIKTSRVPRFAITGIGCIGRYRPWDLQPTNAIAEY